MARLQQLIDNTFLARVIFVHSDLSSQTRIHAGNTTLFVRFGTYTGTFSGNFIALH